ncbi:chaperone DnaK1 domain protein [Mycobacterium ulcerans str. Harvey]|uniref:Chaperone DnaK1 domain protein n=1 Tax=Mycobacterium ulcerans str. Harvey TaxID=1299332 RepID=A0ABN0QKT2_MYCUL|nr:chaperone DnaK1 domain protein [Mycobacterium ulcerans str. Harvey]
MTGKTSGISRSAAGTRARCRGALRHRPSGAVEVTLTTHPAGFNRTFRLQRHVPARS